MCVSSPFEGNSRSEIIMHCNQSTAALEKIRDIARIESESRPSTSFDNHAEKICSPLGRKGLPSFHQTSVRWPRKADRGGGSGWFKFSPVYQRDSDCVYRRIESRVAPSLRVLSTHPWQSTCFHIIDLIISAHQFHLNARSSPAPFTSWSFK